MVFQLVQNLLALLLSLELRRRDDLFFDTVLRLKVEGVVLLLLLEDTIDLVYSVLHLHFIRFRQLAPEVLDFLTHLLCLLQPSFLLLFPRLFL